MTATERTHWRDGAHWKSTGWFYRPESPSDLFEAIAKLGARSVKHRFAWRGFSDSNYTLTSSLHRRLAAEGINVTEETLRDREESILKQARDWGLGVEGAYLVDDFQLLADLQHFGVPTRLIDVTSNPMTALWFAARRTEKKGTGRHNSTGLLLALNIAPWYTNNKVFFTVGEPSLKLDERREDALRLETPIIVRASVPNARLRAQEGYFIASRVPGHIEPPLTSLQSAVPQPTVEMTEVFGRKSAGLPTNVPFIAIEVLAENKDKVMELLGNNYGREASVMFPDFNGFQEYGGWKPRPVYRRTRRSPDGPK